MQSPPLTRRARPGLGTDRAVSLEAEVLTLAAARADVSEHLRREVVSRVAAGEALARALAERDASELFLKRTKESMGRLEAERNAAVAQLAASDVVQAAGTRALRELAVALDKAQKVGIEAVTAREAFTAQVKKISTLAAAAKQVASQASAVAAAACSERDAAIGKVSRLRVMLRRAYEDGRSQGITLAMPREFVDDD